MYYMVFYLSVSYGLLLKGDPCIRVSLLHRMLRSAAGEAFKLRLCAEMQNVFVY